MSKKSKKDVDSEETNKSVISKSFFNELNKMNPEATFLNESSLSNITGYHDTGSAALNAIISGDLEGGVPRGRITGFQGESSTGKSLLITKIIALAQKEDPELYGVIWDSEAAVDAGFIKNIGGDPTRIKYMPVETIEDCRNQIVTFLNKINANKETKGKFIIAIDSLGNLASAKELADAAAGKSATDMGIRAKQIKSMMRTITFAAAKANVAVLFSNHTYDDPSSMFPTMVKSSSGGKGPVFLASVLVQLSRKLSKHDEKNEEDEVLGLANKVSGVTIGAMTVKNRFVPPFLKTELYLNFKTGLDRYTGITEIAEQLEIISKIEGKTTYSFNWGLSNNPSYNRPSDVEELETIGFRKTWNTKEFWRDKDRLEYISTIIKEKIGYSVEELEKVKDEDPLLSEEELVEVE